MSSGFAALALAVIVGSHDPGLAAQTKDRLAGLMADQKVGTQKIEVKAKSVTCRAGDVDIAAFACTLAFADTKVILAGRPAHELFATVAENGVPGSGAAGTVYEALNGLDCRLDPAEIASKDGGGAACTFTPGG